MDLAGRGPKNDCGVYFFGQMTSKLVLPKYFGGLSYLHSTMVMFTPPYYNTAKNYLCNKIRKYKLHIEIQKNTNIDERPALACFRNACTYTGATETH